MAHVYCTDCINFRLCDEGKPYCPYENKCNINDCEDSTSIEERPYYETKYQINRKAIYVTGLLTELSRIDEKISLMEQGKIRYSNDLYMWKYTLKQELNG